MRVLVACEHSGIVREAFRALGHDAWSCDILPAQDNSEYHYQEDVFKLLERIPNWDLMIAHPPCTHLAVSGARWFKDKPPHLQKDALDFVQKLMDMDIPKIAIENPVGVISSKIRKPDQYIQPYEYGHTTRKKTGLWLKNLPLLEPTNIVEPILKTYANGKTFSADYGVGFQTKHGHRRSLFFEGIAEAMAKQWGEINE